jgi:hypothetical protein
MQYTVSLALLILLMALAILAAVGETAGRRHSGRAARLRPRFATITETIVTR